ncbi:type II secretion system protein J [Bowmanella yangjiangensis]|uniref:Type II secretion system protein n=1 Tax=Bowmanella yangjiangensis TaxID=2811230 RepID=A0ABS3CV11_9ALTE|nr:type II secretion system protein [Bowmanella yangjiangensis]MBN7820440.1 type II secretion system protein [Bowmanella yangjiangensis]
MQWVMFDRLKLLRSQYPTLRSVNQGGFTLIEMLVVLVILAMTTTLLAQGLATTWRNFEKMDAKILVQSSADLPVVWFQQSIRGAVLYHPYIANAKGLKNSFEFVSSALPDDSAHIPQGMSWQIVADNNYWYLQWLNQNNPQLAVEIQRFDQSAHFEYLVEDSWQSEFLPDTAVLPRAVRIVNGDIVWAMAVIGRPQIADMPPELQAFGIYEFGG